MLLCSAGSQGAKQLEVETWAGFEPSIFLLLPDVLKNLPNMNHKSQ